MAVAICRSRGCERRTLCLSWRPSHVLHEGLAFGLAHSRSSGCAHLQAHRFRMSTRSIAAPSPDSVQFILDIGNTSARCSTPAAEARTTPACAGRRTSTGPMRHAPGTRPDPRFPAPGGCDTCQDVGRCSPARRAGRRIARQWAVTCRARRTPSWRGRRPHRPGWRGLPFPLRRSWCRGRRALCASRSCRSGRPPS